MCYISYYILIKKEVFKIKKKYSIIFSVLFIVGLLVLSGCSLIGQDSVGRKISAGTGVQRAQVGGGEIIFEGAESCGSGGSGSSVDMQVAADKSHENATHNCVKSKCGTNDNGVVSGRVSGAGYTDTFSYNNNKWTVTSSMTVESVDCSTGGGGSDYTPP